ncbi:hypothetical protein FZEAL_1027 [Fusarium zealandicum]|uniref:Integral membrane protein n=1 Tax=Fusarium zealandicum TaxID=1053134 RepID=A0A8H4UTN3_9HYPO|nr:hypothetical protein FZEAL_1027 [Fusarium zealandicum]
MGQYGYLIPDSYVREVPGQVDMNTASIFWGFSLAVALFSAGKAGKQSWRSWRRSRRITAYVMMIWAVWLSSMVLGALAWGFWFYLAIALFWALQVQFLLQIILNRLGLLMVSPGRATRLKWVVFGIILAVNISVFIIWMPARLQINDTWIHLNIIWDRCEKVIFALVDGALNGYFIYLVRSRLIENGLTKYVPLYRMNLVVLVGLMSMPSSLVYLSFHPVCYLLKLQIEMKMAELITKIVQSAGAHGSEDIYYRHSSTGNKSKSARGTKSRFANGFAGGHNTSFRGGNTTQVEAGGHESDIELETRDRMAETGIIKTVQTMVARDLADEGDDGDVESRTSSTRKLHH